MVGREPLGISLLAGVREGVRGGGADMLSVGWVRY